MKEKAFLTPVDREWVINFVDTIITNMGTAGRRNLLHACFLPKEKINRIVFDKGSRTVAEEMVELVEIQDTSDFNSHYLEDLLRHLVEMEASREPSVETRIENLLAAYSEAKSKAFKGEIFYNNTFHVNESVSNISNSNKRETIKLSSFSYLRLIWSLLLSILIIILVIQTLFPYFVVKYPFLTACVALPITLIITLLCYTAQILISHWVKYLLALINQTARTFFTFFNQKSQSAVLSIEQNANMKQESYTDSSLVFHFNERLTDYTEFFGRVRERRTLINRTRQRNSTSIVGPRRIGKTWLLDYLRLIAPTELGANFRVALLDTKMPNLKTVADFTARALNAFGVSFPFAPEQAYIEMLEKFVIDLGAKNIIPVLCIDEFEGFFDQIAFDYEFFENLRFMADKRGLVLVTTSKRPLMDLVSDYRRTSPFFNIFEQLALKPFDERDAQEFALVKSTQAEFTDNERITLLQYGRDKKGQQEWLPLRLQLVGKQLLEDKNLEIQERQRTQSIVPRYYNPQDQNYWHQFEERIEEKYRAVISL